MGYFWFCKPSYCCKKIGRDKKEFSLIGKFTENTRIKVVKLCAVILNYFGHEETIACVNRLTDQPLTKIVVLENSDSEDDIVK